LGKFWEYIGRILGNHWANSGNILREFWEIIGRILGNHWANTRFARTGNCVEVGRRANLEAIIERKYEEYIFNAKYIFLVVSSMIFISCNNNEGIPHCESTSDCDYEWVCVANRCRSNPCEDYYCGTGTCTVIADSSEVDERGDVYCACDENSLPYKYFSDSSYPLI
jgi:hypothetical protein